MFQRRAREPFPVRNIIFLALIVLVFIVLALSQRKKQEIPATPPATEQPTGGQ